MTSKLEKQLQHARPKLKVVSPLAHWIVLVMAWFNIILGISLYFGVDEHRITASFLIVNELLTFDFWGILFLALGLIKLFSLYSNNWKLARTSLFLGVSVKAAWAVALTIRTFISPGTVFVNILWVTIAMMQMGAYIWFLPPAEKTELPGHSEDK